MEPRHQDPENFYKELEKEWNKRIHAYTNSRTFTRAFGKTLDKHLDYIVIQRKLINNLLTVYDVPNKDEFVTLAGKKVDCVERVDNLEETIYELKMNLEKNNTVLKKLNNSLLDLLSLIEGEVKNIKKSKIKTLEKELEELKFIFKDKK